MSEKKKLYATFTWDNYRNDGDEPQRREVTGPDEAVQYGTQARATFFTLSEVPVIEVGGRIFSGEMENVAGRHYLNADRLYSPAEVITELHKAAKAPGMGKLLKEMSRHGMKKEALQIHQALTNNPLEEEYRKEPATTRYVRLPYSGFAKLSAEDTAHDSSGQQLWPLPAPQPAPAATPAEPPKLQKPSDRPKLK